MRLAPWMTCLLLLMLLGGCASRPAAGTVLSRQSAVREEVRSPMDAPDWYRALWAEHSEAMRALNERRDMVRGYW
jgi:hypothetical protein